MSGISDEKNDSLNNQLIVAFLMVVVMFYLAHEHLFSLYAFVWRYLKIAQMYPLAVIDQMLIMAGQWFGFSGLGFTEGLQEIMKVHFNQITPEYIKLYDSFFGGYLRYPFGFIVLWVAYNENKIRSKARRRYNSESLIRNAAKVHKHLRPYVPPTKFEAFVGKVFGWLLPSYKEKLKGENPMNFSHDFNFNDRSAFTNRYAMGVSHYEMLTANPPLGVTQKEIERDKLIQEEKGFASDFRPIAYFYYHENHSNSYVDFCTRTATLSLERLLLCKVEGPFASPDAVGRLFDNKGNLVPLKIVNKKGESVDVFTKGCSVIGGYRPSNLLNEGQPYKGEIDDVLELFNGIERRILLQLKAKMPKGMSRTFEEIVYATVLKRHAFSTTVIWSVMELFKDINRIAGTEFTWVMRLDRGLGMLMQSIGRETPFIESASIRAHYLIEKSVGAPVTTPSVLTAVQDLSENANRIIIAGKKKETLLNMSEESYAEMFNVSEMQKGQSQAETKAVEILKGMGFDIEKDETVYENPFPDMSELMKNFDGK